MSDWTAGYVADIAYTYGYYAELSPLRARLPLLHAGVAVPETGTACELGFGQGISVNMHAAGSTTQWFGTDFNPAQAGFAQELAAAAVSGAALYDQSFEEFCGRPDLPDFDFIGLHGIWSWISDDNRRLIVNFVRRKLKVGGVLYISYNTLPGWAGFAPMRHLMTQHAEVLGGSGQGSIARVSGALGFAEKLLGANPGYLRANPQITERLAKIKDQDKHYLAHEYFNRDWHPMYFSAVAQMLGSAKLTYACSATYLDHIDALNLTEEQQRLLKEISDPVFRELVRDYVVNQQFRKDYWVKGARRLTILEQAEAIRSQKFLLVAPRVDVSLKVSGALGEATLNEQIYGPILDCMADHKPRSIGQIEVALKERGVNYPQIVQSVLVLTGNGTLAPVQEDAPASRSRKQTERLNLNLAQKARSSNDFGTAASPVTGQAYGLGRFSLLFTLAMAQGHKLPPAMAAYAMQILTSQGQKLIKEGKTLETPEENLQEMNRIAQQFVNKQLPILKALQIV